MVGRKRVREDEKKPAVFYQRADEASQRAFLLQDKPGVRIRKPSTSEEDKERGVSLDYRAAG